jgi:serine/threonine protein kinase
LKGTDWDLLHDQACRLEQAWREGNGPVDLACFLPPPESPLRASVLRELIKTDLEMRWRARCPEFLEDYLSRFPELGPPQALDSALIYEEYRVRSLFGDHPDLEVYRRRFPAQLDELRRLLTESPLPHLPATVTTPPQDVELTQSPTTRHPAGAPAHSEGTAQTEPSPTLPPSTPGQETAPAIESRSGEHILPSEGYTLGEEIGQGEFGRVYRARAPGGGEVAVKMIHRPLSDLSSQRELKALELIRSLRHTYLLQTHCYWSLKDRLVIVMELADDSLHDWLRQCQKAGLPGVPTAELVTFFKEAAEALDFLHANNVMHRDIKPANLLRLKGHAKVADFGLARLQHGRQEAATVFGGTLLYMPPECWRNEVSVQSDQYSLAVTYAEMRLGRRVIRGRSMPEIMQEHLLGTPDLAGLGEAETRVVSKALSKNPEHRYSTCSEFACALAAALLPPAPTPAVEQPPPRRRHRWLTAIAAVAGILVGLTLVGRWAAEPWLELSPGCHKDSDPQTTVVEVYGKRRYSRIVHPLPNAEPLVFLLMPHTPSQNLPAFYILRDKVTFEQFDAVLKDPRMDQLLQRHEVKSGDWSTLKRKWENPNWYNPSQARHPVVGVTPTEAHCFAVFVGGLLPTGKQWDKAGGRWDDAKFACDEPAWQPRTKFEDVGVCKADESLFHCRDMCGNGYEWLRDVFPEGKSRYVPLKEPVPEERVERRSGPPEQDSEAFGFPPAALSLNYDAAPDNTGFRVVIEIRP